MNSSGGLKNQRIGMIPCWFEKLLIPDRVRQRFLQYHISVHRVPTTGRGYIHSTRTFNNILLRSSYARN